MSSQPFLPNDTGTKFGEVAGDFTAQTLDGPWTLSENFTGCDSYVFVNYFAHSHGDQIWGSDPAGLFAQTPPNVHYFFGSYSSDGSRATELQQVKAKFDAALAVMAPQDRDWWSPRIHYVTTAPTAIAGSVGAYYQGLSPNIVFTFGIDRNQRFDPGGSLSRIVGSGFSGDIMMAAFLPRYYNFVFDRDAKAATETVDDVLLLDNQLVTKNNELYEVTFPDASKMASYDQMTLDISASCGPQGGDCGEWDYEAYLELCENDDCSTRHQIGLWITPYSRPGTRRWLVDATPFLGLLTQGGTRKVRFGMLWNMNANTMRVSFRLANTGAGMRPVAVTPLFGGGEFSATYNDKYTPIDFTPPVNTKKIELVALLTGHGQSSGNNCAEWCNHEHTFTVNAAEHTKSHAGQAGKALGCADRIDEGVVPGQYGNWAPSRAVWCPGLAVQPWRVDITNDVTLGEANTMSYRGNYNGGLPAGGRIRLSSYLVYYE
jgi:hypothetical protein